MAPGESRISSLTGVAHQLTEAVRQHARREQRSIFEGMLNGEAMKSASKYPFYLVLPPSYKTRLRSSLGQLPCSRRSARKRRVLRQFGRFPSNEVPIAYSRATRAQPSFLVRQVGIGPPPELVRMSRAPKAKAS